MIEIRRNHERGRARLDWLDSAHTFSFGEYYDPRYMGFRALRVINEDHIAPARGFGPHPHRDMEILTYMLAGQLQHRDSMGQESIIRPGRVQRMSAGTGVVHSETNPSPDEPAHLLQIWIEPDRPGHEPGYEEGDAPVAAESDRWHLIAGPEGAGGAVTIHQDARVSAARVFAGVDLRYALGAERHAWVQVARGAVQLNGQDLEAGDGAAVSGEPELLVRASAPAELLVFDLA